MRPSARNGAVVRLLLSCTLNACLQPCSGVQINDGMCLPGTFGPSCQFDCHCTNLHCDTSGICTGNATCVKGWSGPSCQIEEKPSEEVLSSTSKTVIIAGSIVAFILLVAIIATIWWGYRRELRWAKEAQTLARNDPGQHEGANHGGGSGQRSKTVNEKQNRQGGQRERTMQAGVEVCTPQKGGGEDAKVTQGEVSTDNMGQSSGAGFSHGRQEGTRSFPGRQGEGIMPIQGSQGEGAGNTPGRPGEGVGSFQGTQGDGRTQGEKANGNNQEWTHADKQSPEPRDSESCTNDRYSNIKETNTGTSSNNNSVMLAGTTDHTYDAIWKKDTDPAHPIDDGYITPKEPDYPSVTDYHLYDEIKEESRYVNVADV